MEGTFHQQVRRQRNTLLLVGLVFGEVVLGFLHIAFTWPPAGTYAKFTVRLFHLDREFNFPTLFSATQFVILGMTLLAIRKASQLRGESEKKSRYWLFLATGAFFLAVDEMLLIHEAVGTLLGRLAKAAPSDSSIRIVLEFPGYFWALIYVPIALPLCVVAARFLWRELGRYRWLPILGMCVFFAGAVGLDFWEGALGTSDHKPFPVTLLGFTFTFDAFLFEELFEMFGVTLALAGCLGVEGELVEVTGGA